MPAVSRFDYVRLIYRIDHDAFQAHIIPGIRRVAAECKQHVEDATTYKVASLGYSANGDARYVIDVWGEMADYFVMLMPLGWWDLLYRLDLRVADESITESAIAGIGAYYGTKAPGTVGINTFNTPGARKTDRRDVGGRGVRFGSRKSDHHMVMYKRRSEVGAVEYRVQGKEAKRLGQIALVNATSDTLGAVYEQAFRMMQGQMDDFVRKATGKSSYVSIVEWGENFLKNLRFADKTRDAKHEEEADAWMRSLPEQEQMDLQAASWVPTAKGLHEPEA